jgi:hypothetical protein
MVDIMQKTLAIFGKEFRFSEFGDADNEVLGVGLMDEGQVRKVLKRFVGAESGEAGDHDAAMIEPVSSTVKEA